MEDETLMQRVEEQPPPPQPERAAAPLWQGLRRNLRAGLRLALLCRTEAAAFAALPCDLVLLALVDPALNLLISRLLAGGDGIFTPESLPSFFFHIPLFLAFGLGAARLLADPGLVTTLPVAFIALSLVLETLHGLLEGAELLTGFALPDWLMAAPHYYRFFLWWTAGAALFLGRLGSGRRRQGVAVAALFLIMVVMPLALVPRGDLWTAAAGEGEELLVTEKVLDTQARLLPAEIGRLLPGRPGVTDLYFVGFAGDGGQGVFMRELLAVERLFSARFDTAGRELILVNNAATALEYPFATATNLGRALKGIGEAMNRDEDVLFLYLTSHGSEDGTLAVENGPLELTQVTPELLRRQLDEAGIRWRVIAVSACFAGSYIDPLKDERTLIMTAADATHESFGCQYGADFTWFGKAYFDEALRTSRSFTAAFTTARESIRARETAEGETPSNPQLFIGPAMAAKLPQLEERLATLAPGR